MVCGGSRWIGFLTPIELLGGECVVRCAGCSLVCRALQDSSLLCTRSCYIDKFLVIEALPSRSWVRCFANASASGRVPAPSVGICGSTPAVATYWPWVGSFPNPSHWCWVSHSSAPKRSRQATLKGQTTELRTLRIKICHSSEPWEQPVESKWGLRLAKMRLEKQVDVIHLIFQLFSGLLTTSPAPKLASSEPCEQPVHSKWAIQLAKMRLEKQVDVIHLIFQLISGLLTTSPAPKLASLPPLGELS